MKQVECYFLDMDDSLLFMRNDPTEFIDSEAQYQLDAVFPIEQEKRIGIGMKIGFRNIDDVLVFYEIKDAQEDPFDMTVRIYAEHAAMSELLDEVIVDMRPSSVQAGAAVNMALNGTRWSLRTAATTGIASCRFWYCSAWDAMQTIVEKWGCALVFSWGIDDSGITGRYVDVKQSLGQNRGKRFELSKDISAFKVIYNDDDVCTALYGRGKGEEIEDVNGDTAYGRKISFADVMWSTANGDPADKPKGQEWVEDVDATAAYGRNGRKKSRVISFDECEDPAELLQLTWDALQKAKSPTLTIRATVADLEMVWGRKFEAVRLGDDVSVIVDNIDFAVQIVATDIRRNYVYPEKTSVTLGNEVQTIADIQASANKALQAARDNAIAGAQVAAKNPDLLRGILDTMTTRILSSGTNMYTDENDGSLVFENPESTAAVKITGEGILIASKKVDNQWQWGTAMNGEGIVADMITTGTIQATLIRILGSDMFYWDASNIHIHDPDNLNNQIRIGMYDGENYGIGFTRDGGQTWASAIDFHGAHVTAEDRYSAITVTNNSLVFLADENGECEAKTYTCKVLAYTGNAKVDPVVTGVTGNPDGMTVTVGSIVNHEVTLTISVEAGALLGGTEQQSGTLNVAASSPVAMSKVIAWCKVNAGHQGVDGEPGADGSNGINQAFITLYKRAAQKPTVKPTGCAYSFNTAAITGTLNGWSMSIPESEEPCYSISAMVVSALSEISVPDSAWSGAILLFENGEPGADGQDAETHYTWLKYADTPTSGMSDSPDGKKYMGFAYNKTTSIESTNYADYMWSLIKGTDGQDGTNGVDGDDGVTYYTWVKYADDATGRNMTNDPTDKFYIGLAYNKTTPEESTVATDYKWSLYRGSNGIDGQDGQDGLNTASVILYIRAENAPTAPNVDLLYTFATAGITGELSGWTQNIPTTNGCPCWITTAQAVGKTSVVTIPASAWSSTAKLVEDGEAGAKTYHCKASELPDNVKAQDLWIDIDDNNKIYRYDGTQWVSVQDLNIPDVIEQLASASSAFEVLDKSIQAKVDATYFSDQLGSLKKQLESSMELDAKALTTKFETTISDETGKLDTKYSTMIRMSGDGVEIGKSDSNFRTLLSNEKLAFLQYTGDVSTEVAYISNKKLYITDAQITRSLAIGAAGTNTFTFEKTSEGLSLRYASAQ